MSWSRATLACLALLALAGCGWQPLYGRVNNGSGGAPGGNAGPQLAAVHITPIADRGGQNLSNALRDRINPRGSPEDARYSLLVRISEPGTQLLIIHDQ